MDGTYETLIFEQDEDVVTVTLNRPDQFNALDHRMAKELMEVSIRCDEESGIRAVILTGAGDRAFCAGGDLLSFSREGDGLPTLMKELTTYLHAAVSRFSRMNAPLIGAINGVAAGAGISLAAMVDFAVAAQSARFVSAYTQAGLTPDGSCTYFLPRLMGLRRTMEFMLTNRVLGAPEALEWGLVNQVVPDAELRARVTELARTLASGATGAFGGVKRLLHNSFSETLESQMEMETRIIAERARTRDGREGIESFVQKRDPLFSGD